MYWIFSLLSLASAAFFLFIETVILAFAINNRHYAYYFALVAVFSVASLFGAKRIRATSNQETTKALKVSELVIRVVTIIILVLGCAVLVLNYIMNTL
ncbi:MAG: hypothetical protein ACOYXT_10085 [Bacteroidota bacterium]